MGEEARQRSESCGRGSVAEIDPSVGHLQKEEEGEEGCSPLTASSLKSHTDKTESVQNHSG